MILRERVRCWAERQMPEPGLWWPWPTPWRLRLASVILSPREGWRWLREDFRRWTALPGDRFVDLPRYVEAVVQDVKPDGVTLLCAGHETLVLIPDVLGRAYPSDLPDHPYLDARDQPRYLPPLVAPDGHRVPLPWREITTDLRSWMPR